MSTIQNKIRVFEILKHFESDFSFNKGCINYSYISRWQQMIAKNVLVIHSFKRLVKNADSSSNG